ncbi:vacuolar-type Ca2+-ATPase, putative, partial [Bodo saltans]
SSHVWLSTIEGDCAGPFTNSSTIEYLGCAKYCKDEGGYFTGEKYCQQGKIHSTIIFNTYIWMQIFNIFNARLLTDVISPLHGLFSRSLMLCIIVLLICGFQVFAIEAAGSFMQTTPLKWRDWLVCIGLGAAEIPYGVLVRLLPVENEIPQEVIDRWEHENNARRLLGVEPSPFSRAANLHKKNGGNHGAG